MHFGLSPKEIGQMSWRQINAYISYLADMNTEQKAAPKGGAKGFRPLTDAQIIESARQKGIL